MNQDLITPAGEPPESDAARVKSARTVAMVVYALQALALFVGLTAIVAIIINYVKQADVRDTWVHSHFRWQIRTFWFSVLWTLIGLALMVIAVGYLVLFANAVWVIYRIVKGWLRLVDNQPMYAAAAGA